MGMFTRIVAAVDFSDASHDLFHYAVRLAAMTPGAQLHLLHVVPDPLQQPWTVEAAGIDFSRLADDWVEDATRRLQALITAEGPRAASVTPIVLVGRAAETIARYASDLGANAIVMGTHGYGPVRRFMLGSVVERVLRHATCPVLTIPHRGLKALANDEVEALTAANA